MSVKFHSAVKPNAKDPTLAMIIHRERAGDLLANISLNDDIYESKKRFKVKADVVGEWKNVFYCDEVFLDDEPIDYDKFQKIQTIDLGFVAKVVPENVEKMEYGTPISMRIYEAQRVYIYTLPYLLEKTTGKNVKQSHNTTKTTGQANKTKKQKTP
ncbi:MAG: hypothetical protein JHC26_04865 [Thermofilum sp.]|jgi:hypothetical protein|uniref:hypothetical protein n=1 Tax=Thermofilum sp. TaxID=1961369 RepID=UPI002586A145|nr:hypothetical protein [Thermofilum sp.]MCI4408400.1 hypothetical protein [Thermofilum sp.]